MDLDQECASVWVLGIEEGEGKGEMLEPIVRYIYVECVGIDREVVVDTDRQSWLVHGTAELLWLQSTVQVFEELLAAVLILVFAIWRDTIEKQEQDVEFGQFLQYYNTQPSGEQRTAGQQEEPVQKCDTVLGE